MERNSNNLFEYIKDLEERLRILERNQASFKDLEKLVNAPTGADRREGRIYFDTTTKKARVYDGTAWRDLH